MRICNMQQIQCCKLVILMDSSPIKSNKDRKRFESGSYKNLQLHSALDQAKHFSNLVNHHLAHSLRENHVLSTAKSQYQQSNKRIVRTGSLSQREFTKRLSSSIQTNPKNPQSAPLIDNFHTKTLRIPEIGELFKAGIEEERSLRKTMKELKEMISQERKSYDKIYMRTCKIMNKEDDARANIRKMEEESVNNKILMNQLIEDCNSLNQQLRTINNSNVKCVSKIQEVRNQVQDCTIEVSRLKRQVATDVQELRELKGRQSIAYKGMISDYAMLNQLKEEKALLLNHIDQDIHKNQ